MSHCAEIPLQATAGLSFRAAVPRAAYPAPAWTVTLHLRGPGQADLIADAQGAIAANAAATAAWAAGAYRWVVRATDGDDAVEIDRGSLVVEADLAAVSAAMDGRTPAEIALAAIEAVLAKRATLDQERYSINNRELYRTPIADLIKLRDFYVNQVRREKAKAQGRRSWGRPVQVRFS